MAAHGRILDRRRLRLFVDPADVGGVLDALDGYRNTDGGYGWGLEPDLRSPGSQPAAALHALEIFNEVAPAISARTAALCDWLASVSLPDGGLPFALPIGDPAGCSPWWVAADSERSSLQITAAVAAQAHRLADHDPAVERHAWLERATRFCVDAIRGITDSPHAYELSFALQFVDAAAHHIDNASALLERLAAHLPRDGILPVAGGLDDERLGPLDYSRHPDGPVRNLLAADVIDDDLTRLAAQQQRDGGWPVGFATSSPAAALEWRGYITVHAVKTLQANS